MDTITDARLASSLLLATEDVTIRRDELCFGWWIDGRFIADHVIAESSSSSATIQLVLRDLAKEEFQ